MSPALRALRGLRVAAVVGGIAACVLVVVGFTVSLIAGLVALFLFPVIPLVFVLGLEAIRGDREG
jgi:hypothetical protein